MAWPTRARPRLSGHTCDIAQGKLDPLHAAQESEQHLDTFAALHALVDRQVISHRPVRDADLVAASQARLPRQLY